MPHRRLTRLRPLPRALRAALLGITLAGPATGLVAGLTVAPAAHAQDASRNYSIPAGPLGTVLSTFAAAADITLSFEADQTRGLQSPGLNGRYGVADGLARLLEGSGLEAVHRGSGNYVLQKTPPVVKSGAEAVLPAVNVTAESERSATTEGTGSYAASGSTLFKGAQSLKEIPQSVTIVTRQQMDDQGLDTLEEVLSNTTGITLRTRPDNWTEIYSRGFVTTNIQYDGIPLVRGSASGNASSISAAYLDRVEVLRGAQGLLEGAGNPGGAINVVRKRGLADTAFQVEGRIGSWDKYGVRLDAGGALNADKTLRARAVLDYEDKDSFVDTLSGRNLNVYGALDFDLTPDTTLGLGIAHAYSKGSLSSYYGVPRYADGRELDISRSTYVGAKWNDAERRETQVFVDLEHRFSPDWKLKITGAHIEEDWDSATSAGMGLVPVGGSSMPYGVGYDYGYGAKSAGLDASLSGKFSFLGVQHETLLGGSYARQERDDGYLQYWNHAAYGDVFNVDHDVPRLGTTAPTGIWNGTSDTRQKGLYGMLRSHLTDALTLVLGARASWYEYESNGKTTMKETGETTPYAGLVYALTPQWSAYASYADIFQPQTATDANRRVLEPIVGANYEVGVKGELFDGALNASLAIFRIDQENRAVTDLVSPPVCGDSGTNRCSRAAGKVRSEGVELEAHGKLAAGWQVTGGYTYNRNEYLNDNVATNVGKPFEYVTPKHMLRLWSDYRLPGELNQWRVGVGVNYRSEQKSNNPAMQKNPIQGAYAVWNARVAYQIDKTWQAALNIDNVFDKRYFSYVEDYWHWYNYFGAPRNFTLTVRGSF
ncbi:TonB-dependent siderophore receptor [Pseudothauera rhizosphaerae]|uniref:TonB-dependent siderophore receptor n=1 Tax=Pseudothauera rhizosphaerae TaxID=2565932 RepID=A0A4S4AVY7_9RHOO|nr:TonB-dependent receptor [Pseudothauera rhizosphaerae]THF63385.1 TonB-dependent siderophore receptor [Pseudothauera rhizosphaerae]